MKKLFGKRLRELRRQKDITQEKLAELIEIKPENYSRIENGLSFPKPENIEKIANALNVEITDLFRFNTQLDTKQMIEKITNKIQSDDETLIITYKFLNSLGKI